MSPHASSDCRRLRRIEDRRRVEEGEEDDRRRHKESRPGGRAQQGRDRREYARARRPAAESPIVVGGGRSRRRRSAGSAGGVQLRRQEQVWPSYIIADLTVRAVISPRRCARSMKTMKATTTDAMMMTTSTRSSQSTLPARLEQLQDPWAGSRRRCGGVVGQEPSPTPRDLICSRSHTEDIVPATSVTMVEETNVAPGSLVGAQHALRGRSRSRQPRPPRARRSDGACTDREPRPCSPFLLIASSNNRHRAQGAG